MPSTPDLAARTAPTSHRVLHARLLPVALVLLAVVASLLALAVSHDGTDTALGAVTGASLVLALSVVVVQLLGHRVRRRERAEREAQRLDGLEPLRAARRDEADGHPG